MPRLERGALKRALVMLSAVSNAYPISPANPRSIEAGSGTRLSLILSWGNPSATLMGSASTNTDAWMHRNMMAYLDGVVINYNPPSTVSIRECTGISRSVSPA
jgi:hypothetical protein